MNNQLPSSWVTTSLPKADLLDATALVAAALRSGRIKLNPDNSFTVDGIPLPAPVLPAKGLPATADNTSANKFLFDGKNWTLQFDGMA